MKEDVFILQHVYQVGNTEEVKFIGVYSSLDEAKNAISRLKNKPGFKDYPDSCFVVDRHTINKDSWEEGFTTMTN